MLEDGRWEIEVLEVLEDGRLRCWEIETPVRPPSSSGAGGWTRVGMGTDMTREENRAVCATGSGPSDRLKSPWGLNYESGLR